jgi:hypothetical protein
VAFQAMMELMAQQFPGVFSGYGLSVVESHQRNKADVSGTAKAVVASLQRMGVEGFKEVRMFYVFIYFFPVFLFLSYACALVWRARAAAGVRPIERWGGGAARPPPARALQALSTPRRRNARLSAPAARAPAAASPHSPPPPARRARVPP